MIQDIAPHKYLVDYQPDVPKLTDVVLVYRKKELLSCYKDGEICYPTIQDVQKIYPDIRKKAKYLFRIDERDFYELRKPQLQEFDHWKYEDIEVLRETKPIWKSFAGVTGYQIHSYYTDTKYCGRCGTKMIAEGKERAMKCPSCGKITYPSIAPSVIVGVIHKDRILLTKYSEKHSSYRKYALVAGYNEVGETLEETVKREVMEEVGLKVKNIQYYKSQPWAYTGTLLAGFFCEVDGSVEIKMDQDELSEAGWFCREEIPAHLSNHSLTNDMMNCFRKGEVKKYETRL